MNILLEILVLLATLLYSIVEALVLKFVPASPKDIQGKLVLVTGGGRGIGRALALRFSQEGAKLAICDVEKSAADDAAQEIVGNGGIAKGYACDVSDLEAVKKMADEIRRDQGNVEILVNNAGVCHAKELLSLTERDIRRTLGINCMAHFWTLKEFLPAMMLRDYGHVVTIASMSAKTGVAYLTDYSASKWGVYGLTESLAVELKEKEKFGIKTSIVCPLFVNTKLISDLNTRVEMRDRFGKILEPAEVAEEVVRGVLTNQAVIYIPDRMKNVDITRALFPKRFQDAMYKFLDSRIAQIK